MILELKNINKKYGNQTVLNNVSFSAGNGVVALLGNNGAGKTTLINIIVGLLDADSGDIIYDGKNMKENKREFRRTLGYLPQDCGMYDGYTGIQFLQYMASIKNVNKLDARNRIKMLMEEVNLWEHRDKKIKNYSGGMKHRLGICQAMLNTPDCLILDEPTTGLDYNERRSFKEMIAEYSKNHLVIISTHILSDLDNIANHVIILNGGTVIEDDKCNGLVAEKYGKYLGRVEGE